MADCLHSIIAQNLEKANISYEIFCIDDGSKDGSWEFLSAKLQEIPQLRIEKNECNRGVSYTRNRLLYSARGKYIWFIDPDDMLLDKAVSAFYYEAEKYHVDILLGDYIRVDEETSGNQNYNFDFKSSGEISPIKDNDCLPQDSAGRRMCAVWAGLFLKDFLLRNSLTMNERMIAQEDTLFYYEFSLKTDNIWKWNIPCYLYRQRNSSVMHARNDERSKKYYLAMREMLRVYEAHLSMGDDKNIERLHNKIHHSKQNIAACLAAVFDAKYIKKELRILKKERIYPYKFRKEALKGRDSIVFRILLFLLPIEPFFWIYHLIYKMKYKDKT